MECSAFQSVCDYRNVNLFYFLSSGDLLDAPEWDRRIVDENNLQVYYGILQHDVTLVEERNKLEWVKIDDELLNNEKFAGNYNIPHIVRQIKVYLKNGTGIDKY